MSAGLVPPTRGFENVRGPFGAVYRIEVGQNTNDLAVREVAQDADAQLDLASVLVITTADVPDGKQLIPKVLDVRGVETELREGLDKVMEEVADPVVPAVVHPTTAERLFKRVLELDRGIEFSQHASNLATVGRLNRSLEGRDVFHRHRGAQYRAAGGGSQARDATVQTADYRLRAPQNMRIE